MRGFLVKTTTPQSRRCLKSPTPTLIWAFLCAVLLIGYAPIALGAQEPTESDPATAGDNETPTGFFTEIMDVRVINVEVFVTDRSGQPIAGLARDEFELKVDGEVIPISNFYAEAGGISRDSVGAITRQADSSFVTVEEVETDPARRSYVVLLIDHTRLGANNRKRAFRALREAMGRLGKEDLIAVVGIEGSLVFYSDFLYDRQAVHKILDEVATRSLRSQHNEFERRQIVGELTRGQSGGIQASASLADASFLQTRIRAYAESEYARSLGSLRQIESVVSTLSGVPGRKAVLYLGEGIPTRPGEGLYVEWRNRFGGGNPQAGIGLRRFDFNTDYERSIGRFNVTSSMQKLADRANRSGVTLYAVDAEDNHGGDMRSALTEQGSTSETVSVIDENFRAPLEFATQATGGRLLRSSAHLAEQMVNLLGDFDTYYSLGFVPPADWDHGSAHKIKVEVSGKKLAVRHRESVRMPEPDEREAGATLAALMYQTANNPLGIIAVAGTRGPAQNGTSSLPVTLEIPIGKIGFVPQGDVHSGSLSIYVTTMDAEGEASRVQKIPFHLNIPSDKIEAARADSAHYPLPVVLRAGDRQLAIGIRDDINGVFSAVRVDVSELSRF